MKTMVFKGFGWYPVIKIKAWKFTLNIQNKFYYFLLKESEFSGPIEGHGPRLGTQDCIWIYYKRTITSRTVWKMLYIIINRWEEQGFADPQLLRLIRFKYFKYFAHSTISATFWVCWRVTALVDHDAGLWRYYNGRGSIATTVTRSVKKYQSQGIHMKISKVLNRVQFEHETVKNDAYHTNANLGTGASSWVRWISSF